MNRTERRTALVRLLADLDQRIELAKSLSTNQLLTRDEQRYAAVELDFQLKTVDRVERLLARID